MVCADTLERIHDCERAIARAVGEVLVEATVVDLGLQRPDDSKDLLRT